MKNIIVLLLAITILSCNSEKELKSRYEEIKKVAIEQEPTEIKKYIDSESIAFMDSLELFIGKKEYNYVQSFGYGYKVPLTAMFLYSIASENKEMFATLDVPSDIYFIASMSKLGIFDDEEKLNFHSLDEENINVAMVSMAMPVGNNTNLLRTYKFSYEEGEWKLNLLSTFRKQELIWTRERGSSKLKGPDFIKQLLSQNNPLKNN